MASRAVHTRDLFDLSGRAALVTGGGRGLGRWIATGLAEAGAELFVTSRDLEACRETARQIEANGGRCTPLETDLSDPEQIEALVDAVLARTEHLDVLVNNAARVWAAPTLEYPLEGWDRVFNLNVRGLWLLSQRVARHMRGIRGGSIICVGSISAFRGAPDSEQDVIAYNASKGAVESLTRDLAVKLAPDGIRVNCIAPGPFQTDMMGNLLEDPPRLEAYLERVPLRRAGGENDIKGVAVFLAGPASSFVTGATLVVDGGALSR